MINKLYNIFFILKHNKRRTGSDTIKYLTYFFKGILLLSCLFSLAHVGMYIYSKITPKPTLNGSSAFSFYDNQNKLFYQGNNSQEWINLKKISPYLISATISTEDKRYYQHMGFDYIRIGKAIINNIKNGSKQEGASTITQQYARNLFLNFKKTWKRKIDEAILAFELETHYSKEKILEGYLNTINYGGIYGVENAAKFYFGKSAENLDLAEASILAAIPKNPSRYSPIANPEASKNRQKIILNAMYNNKKITKTEMKKAINKELVYVGKKDTLNLDTLLYYQDAVLKEMDELNIVSNLTDINSLKIYTNFNVDAQTALENAIKNNLGEENELQTMGVVMNPNNGKILALTGGNNYSKSQFNRAIESKRQVGSTMKTFLYYAALENGLTASSTFISEPTNFTFSGNKTYSPKNYGEKYSNSPISMGAALAYSDNIFAVKTHLFLGEQTLVDIGNRIGLNTKLEPIPSLALGTIELSMVELVSGYATFANEGYKVKPHLINKIEDSAGNILYEFKDVKENVLNKSYTFILNELLSNTYDYNLIDYNTPSCVSIAPKLTKKYAIKSGTTATDLLTIGYNKDVVIGIWNGYDSSKEVKETDYKYAKNIWADTIEAYLKDKEDSWYTIPNNVVGVMVNPITGEIATDNDKKKKIFYYIKGTEPFYNSIDLESVFNSNNKKTD